ncbi:MAG: hypothetical protein IIC12_02025 [Proteobacteria bacterium]|nr:hypothetical protein [Pseudomonadota bacterium]
MRFAGISCASFRQPQHERLHAALCFIRAFPDTVAHYRQAQLQLDSIDDRVGKIPVALRSGLWDSGIVGTPIHYSFSFEVASWMARRVPNTVSIDWDEIDDTSRLDELLVHLLLPTEDDYFDSGFVSSKEWIDLAASGTDGTDFDWLLAQLREERLIPIWSQLYDAVELPLVWDLRGAALSKTRNVVPVRKIQPRRSGMRGRVRAVKKEIMRPLDSLKRLSPRSGSRLIDVAMASLAVRHRETSHFNGANSREVYLADVGEGVSIAVFGLHEKYRYPLESTMGYLILSNGVPIGYGGASALFRQVNTGINIFDEYRGSEASFLWTQVMRVYRELFNCTRFIINAYQFGSENTEALESGAFWFYYRLGYRPVLPVVRVLAQRESARMQRDDTYRSDRNMLRRLASCDMHLTLPGARASDLFDERWIETSSMLATKELASTGAPTRAESADRVATKVARDLRMRSINTWSPSEKRGFHRLAPIVATTKPAAWSADAKRSMRKLLRAKGGPFEVEYARLAGQHRQFLSELKKSCRRAEF